MLFIDFLVNRIKNFIDVVFVDEKLDYLWIKY